MELKDLQQALDDFFATSPFNFVTPEMAIDPADTGRRLYESPLLAVGDANDPMWEGLRRPEAVSELFRVPREWMPEARTVVSYFAPFTDFVVEGNMQDPVEVGNGWLYARIEGQAFLHQVNHFIENWFKEHRAKALSPYASPDFKYVFEPGTSVDVKDPEIGFTSNWSERHVAFVCGLGTFGLQKALITERGVCGRFGSVITDVDFPVTKRKYTEIYEYCLMCRACTRCPAKAINITTGKSHHICASYFDTLRDKYSPRFGCGKCYVNVPCARQRPMVRNY